MKIKLSIYDKKHKELFKKNNPHFDRIRKIDQTVVDIPKEDLLVYSLFKEQKNICGFRTYSDLKQKLPSRIGIFGDYLDLNSQTIKARFNNAEDQKMVTESVGIGSSLAIIGHIHGLTAADWNVKPVGPKKDLDYSISSDGKNIIEVESKGNFGDPDSKNSGVSKMKSHIAEKKITQRSSGNRNLLYGAITTYNHKPNDIAHCRLLDPESENNYESPFKLRVLSRLSHYYHGLSFISKSHFLIALANRISVLRLLDEDNFQKLNNLSLVRFDEQDFSFPVSFQYHKTQIPNMEAFGQVTKIGKSKYFLLGFQNEIVHALIKQNYEYLTNLKFRPRTVSDYINAVLKKKDIEPQSEYQDLSHGYVQQRLKGTSYASSDGLMFGVYSY